MSYEVQIQTVEKWNGYVKVNLGAVECNVRRYKSR